MIFPPEHWSEYQSRRSTIRGMLDERCYTIDWLDVMIANGDARVFASPEAVIVVAVKRYPAGATELHGLVAAGTLNAILPLIAESEEWAKGNGVTFAAIASREGWSRVLKESGYRLHQTELRKEL